MKVSCVSSNPNVIFSDTPPDPVATTVNRLLLSVSIIAPKDAVLGISELAPFGFIAPASVPERSRVPAVSPYQTAASDPVPSSPDLPKAEPDWNTHSPTAPPAVAKDTPPTFTAVFQPFSPPEVLLAFCSPSRRTKVRGATFAFMNAFAAYVPYIGDW